MGRILNKYESCRGLTIWKWGKYRIEIWYCPAGYTIREHSHPKEDIELIYVLGSTTFFRRDLRQSVDPLDCPEEYAPMGWKKWLRAFSVKHYHSHWFEVGKIPLIFINVQKFLEPYKPESAAKDFQLTHKD